MREVMEAAPCSVLAGGAANRNAGSDRTKHVGGRAGAEMFIKGWVAGRAEEAACHRNGMGPQI